MSQYSAECDTNSALTCGPAGLHGVLGEADAAFHWLDQAYRQHWGFLMWVKVNPWLTSLHGDPRWGELLTKMGVA